MWGGKYFNILCAKVDLAVPLKIKNYVIQKYVEIQFSQIWSFCIFLDKTIEINENDSYFYYIAVC